MASIRVPDDLIDRLRPYFETTWEKEKRERGHPISPAQINMRILQWVYEQKRPRDRSPL